MHARRALSAALVALAVAGSPARAGDATGVFAPYEDLLQVVADLTWHLGDDLYRFPPPKDPTGHDLYQLSFRRIDNWETRYPGRLSDVTAYTRAEALERLGEYRAAADLYGRVAAESSPLAEPARAAATRAAAFAETAALPERGPDFETTLAVLRKKLDGWAALVTRHAGTPFEGLARAEEERLERVAAELVVAYRAILEDGDATAERALHFLITKHAESKNLPGHILRLGDFYAEMTRDYVAAHERPLGFDEREFVRRADRALDTYRKVATWDGAREKPEAEGRYDALDAYKTAVLARYR